MNRILPLLKKDLRALRPQMFTLWVIMAIACYSDWDRAFPLVAGARIAIQLLVWLAPILCGALAMLAIHQESLIGDRQYWLTRPFTWRDLIASKLLFVALTLNLPLFLFQSASLALHGLSPFTHIPDLLWHQFFLTAIILTTSAALASITRTTSQAVGVALLSVIVGLIAQAVFTLGGTDPNWAGWIARFAIAVIALVTGAIIVVLQYRRRRPMIPRIVFAAAVLLWIPAAALPRLTAHTILPHLSKIAVAPDAYQISFDPRPDRPGEYKHYEPQFTRLEIPIRVTKLRDEDQLIINRLQFSPDVSLAHHVGYGWSRDNFIHDVHDGAGWLRVFVYSSSFARISTTPVDLRVTADLALFIHTQTVQIPQWWSVTDIPGLGRCGPYPAGCVTAHPRVSVESFQGEWFVSYLVAPQSTYSPFPSAYRLNPVEELATAPGTFTVRKPMAWFTRSFELRNIRLADYVR